jgi:hypothetical protein
MFSYISTISMGDLLIFYGIGIALLVFSVEAKLNIISEKSRQSDVRLARNAGFYMFIKTIFNWGFIYFLCGILLLISSTIPLSSKFRPFLFNISFLLSVTFTLYLTLVYLILVIKELVIEWFIARKYEL